jgi:cytochrome c-type biogenesis protein CcmF
VKITVGPPFYNQVNVPIGLALLALIGIGPVIAWRRATFSNLKKNFLKPVSAGIVAAVVLFPVIPLGNRTEIYTYITFVLCVFVLTSMFTEFYKGTVSRMGLHDESAVGALATMTWRNKRRYGGYIVHMGVVLIFAGIAGSQAYGTHMEKHLQVGESFEIRGYTIRYEGLRVEEYTNIKTGIIAQLVVERDGKRYWTGHPEKEFYKGQNQPVSEVDVRSTLASDLYVILADFSEDESATIKVYHNPMVKWIWTGGWIIALGTMVCAWPDRLEQRRRLERLKLQKIVFSPAQE